MADPLNRWRAGDKEAVLERNFVSDHCRGRKHGKKVENGAPALALDASGYTLE